MKPLSRFRVSLDFADSIRNKGLEGFCWSVDPVQRDHRVSPVESIFWLDLVELLNSR